MAIKYEPITSGPVGNVWSPKLLCASDLSLKLDLAAFGVVEGVIDPSVEPLWFDCEGLGDSLVRPWHLVDDDAVFTHWRSEFALAFQLFECHAPV
ncbi:hypothetical protein F0562_019916 [Nyssa sinensis]|uniref:Uncharacterized protein n=1 Tax=Nyssa sinensis TaxID=561372 RepID=A0A5J5BQE6_9ASTE|nr:hypothetical protein F0562_019916 [Nyssa sinensis]